MIYLYSGTPGSGKSLHLAGDIVRKLKKKKQNVIASCDINTSVVQITFFRRILNFVVSILPFKIDLKRLFLRRIGKFDYIPNSMLSVKNLVKYARDNHKKGKEGQTLLVIDECPEIFNPREWSRRDRTKWIKFFQLHRHLGYNIILVAQNDRLIDKQIRSFVEYEVKHRKANNFGTIGMLFNLFFVKLFVAVTYWYGVREKCSVEFFTYKRIYSKLYDSYSVFDKESTIFKELLEDC